MGQWHWEIIASEKAQCSMRQVRNGGSVVVLMARTEFEDQMNSKHIIASSHLLRQEGAHIIV